MEDIKIENEGTSLYNSPSCGGHVRHSKRQELSTSYKWI